MSLRAPESVQKLQTALHAKAKERFCGPYDKLYREDILGHAASIGRRAHVFEVALTRENTPVRGD